MPSSHHACAVVLALLSSCSSGSEPAGDDRAFVPEDLPNSNVNGKDEGLTLIAFTLQQGAAGHLELLSAARNDGDTPACQPGMTTELFDKAGQHVTSVGSVLQTDRFYRLGDGTVIVCVDPGQISMASADVPDSVALDELGSLAHLFPSFTVQGIVPVSGLVLSQVHGVLAGGGTAYLGSLTNSLDVAVGSPRVSVFPTNRVGRPIAVATSGTTMALSAGQSWSFETSSVADSGVAYLAFPAASIAQ